MQLSSINRKNFGSEFLEVILLFSPVLVALLLMLPRLLSPQFGLLDDGLTLLVAEKIKDNWAVAFRFTKELERYFLVNQGGRFYPIYWLFYAILYWLIGPNPFGAFLVNALILAGITGGVIWLVRWRGGSKIQAWAAGMFFVLSGPIIENFYTLSKAEAPQLLCLGASVLIVSRYPQSQKQWLKIIIFLATTFMLLLAILIKETAIVMIPISLGWVVVGYLGAAPKTNKFSSTRWVYLLASLAAGAVFWGVRWYFLPLSLAEGSYTSAYRLEWQPMLASATRWMGWLLRDFSYVIPFGFFMGWLALLKKQSQGRLLLETLIWMMGWVALFLPWSSLQEYYILPFALGSAVFGGLGLGQTLSGLKSPHKPSTRLLAGLCLGLALLPWPPMLANNLTNARLQLAEDTANADLVNFMATLPPQSKVTMNLASINEYVIKTEPLLALTKNRPDITIDYFKFQVASPNEPELMYYVVTPKMKNQIYPAVRVAVSDVAAQYWNQPLTEFLGQSPELVYQTERQVQLFDFGLHRLGCQVFGWLGADGLFCSFNRPLIDTRLFEYGWQVYRVSSQINHLALSAVFQPDGLWQLQKADGTIQKVPFGQPGDIPVVGDWDGDGFTGIGFFRPTNLTWYLDNNLDGQSDQEFQFVEMTAQDIPLTGDWDGNGSVTSGYFRPTDGSWHFRNSNTSGGEDFSIAQLGASTDIPLTGDWDGNGKDTIGLYHPNNGAVELWNEPAAPAVFSAPIASKPVVADWAGHGFDTIAFVTEGKWLKRFFNCDCQPSNLSESFEFGLPKDIPLAGRW